MRQQAVNALCLSTALVSPFHEVTKVDLEKKMQDIKLAICHGRNYTGKLDGETVTFVDIMLLYSARKTKKAQKARKTDGQKSR
jgi:hypothetical protein